MKIAHLIKIKMNNFNVEGGLVFIAEAILSHQTDRHIYITDLLTLLAITLLSVYRCNILLTLTL